MLKNKNLAAIAMAASLCAGFTLPAVAMATNPVPSTNPAPNTNTVPRTTQAPLTSPAPTTNQAPLTSAAPRTTTDTNTTSNNGSAATGTMITLERAFEIAKENTPGDIIKAELKEDFGRLVYRINLVNAENRRVEMNINAQTSEVVYSNDHHYNNDRANRVRAAEYDAERAVEVVMDRHPDSYIQQIEMQEDGDAIYYEVELYDENAIEREIYVNAANGAITQDETDVNTDRSQVRITREDAENRAVAEEPGRVIYTHLNGANYIVTVLKSNGDVYAVHVNATDGNIARTHREMFYLRD